MRVLPRLETLPRPDSVPAPAIFSHARRQAFTLIEILVVIGVIAVLIGILLPALSQARKAGRTVVCLSNQRQIGIGLMSYANEFKEWIPRESGNSEETPARIPKIPAWFKSWTPGQRAQYNLSWAFNLRPFLDPQSHSNDDQGNNADKFKASAYYRCPSRPPDDHNITYVNNGIRFRINGSSVIVDENYTKPPMQTNRIYRPVGVLYLTDFADDPGNLRSANYNNQAASDMHLSIFYDIRRITNINGPSSGGEPTFWRRTAPKRHGRGANAMYMDGHAALIEPDKLLDPQTWDDGDRR
jgi:prepilin-type N-terminal cleavage/methylation domain-containing protein/prepilin-type processing-associated H-X9-DG protein